MIEYLGEQQILHLHRSLLAATGGADGLRDRGMLQSALARPAASFAGQDLYVSQLRRPSCSWSPMATVSRPIPTPWSS